ncbi:Mhr1p [Sugiyamaella lignohabitans]|uniref:Large ribosomal subunit protein mL67 n=1 Tax=Sugiyamaella lignohabitans TaxID=796027 RepID=A0A161HHZ8_9ASCO|nr:Mhr1p [Sugiyamaella lignohabitans]ANB15810.1 Mhr1p [Sugiyamaella lignohabitans]
MKNLSSKLQNIPLKSAQWLRRYKCGPNVFAFRNLETGQVVFSQTLYPKELDIQNQFQFANWQNRLPKAERKDIWRPLAVVTLPNPEAAVSFYENLVQLRFMRDRSMKKQANDWRKKSTDENIWYYGQFRPTYTQEAVADLASAVEASNLECEIKWENEWRRGEDKYWEGITNVNHAYLPKYNPREQTVMLKKIAKEAYTAFRRQEKELFKSLKIGPYAEPAAQS